MKLVVRGYICGKLAFEERLEAGTIQAVVDLSTPLMEKLAAHPSHMMEIECLDLEEDRFFRFGTDPERMVDPLAFELFGSKYFNSISNE